MAISEITADALQAKIRAGENLNILDVRTGLECRTEKLDYPYIHIPLHLLDPAKFVHDQGTSKPVYILCRSGGRARKAAEALVAAGLSQAIVVTGGMGACKACGTPIVTGKTISLERQVRIAAGFLALTGVILGHFVSGYFYILSGAIGGGLIFAGITDKCGLALLLAHAPWNIDHTQEEIQKSLEQFGKKGA
jgi:rhodanese-related sulfurtransferase